MSWLKAKRLLRMIVIRWILGNRNIIKVDDKKDQVSEIVIRQFGQSDSRIKTCHEAFNR